jgi:hypothetical protein
VRTGNVVQFEVMPDGHGYLVVLNVGFSGQLNILLAIPRARDNRIRASWPYRLTIKLIRRLSPWPILKSKRFPKGSPSA